MNTNYHRISDYNNVMSEKSIVLWEETFEELESSTYL